MPKTGLWAIAAVAVITLLLLVYFAATFEAPEGTTTVVLAPPASPPSQQRDPVVEPVISTLPQIRLQPMPEAPAPAAAEPILAPAPVEVPVAEAVVEAAQGPVVQLPSLNRSDDFVLQGLQAMQNGAAVVSLLAQDQIIRKFVVFVENVSRSEFPQTGLPFQPLGQEMPVRNLDDNLFVMDQSAHARFDRVVDTFIAIDTDAAMTFYRTLSPLFQQAYAEIGFRNVSFDETLRRAINNVLQANSIAGPYQLVKPSVMYLYADASIENLQSVNKQLIRLGPDNSNKLQSKLRQFVQQL
jgi:hypothetical protein